MNQFDSLIISIQKISSKKIAEIVVRPNFSGSDDFSVLLNCKNFKVPETFTYNTGITSDDLARAPKASRAFSILRQAFDVQTLPWYAWSEFEAALILAEMPKMCRTFISVEALLHNHSNKTIVDCDHALELFDIPHLGDETETEKIQKLLEKIKVSNNVFCEDKKTKKYIIEMKRQ
jgi:hypothetical protein